MQRITKYIRFYYPLRDFLYLLQLEEYSLKRYVAQVKRRLFKRGFEVRGNLDFTKRLLLILLVQNIFLLLLTITSYVLGWPYYLALLLSIPLLTPVLVAISSLVVSPVAYYLRKRHMQKASKAFAQSYPDTKIIAITGSYGKTTVKYQLESMLKYKYRVAIIQENINTAIGVADLLLQNSLPTQLDYLVVEMGAYECGDIAEFTSMLPPDVSILTVLGDQHLERFGGFENLVHGKYEIFSGAKPDAVCFTTTAAKTILENQGVLTRDVITVPSVDGPRDNQLLAAAVANYLSVSEDVIKDAIETFKPPFRRDSQYTAAGVNVIDNSYNISPTTATVMLKEAAKTAKEQGKKLVVMTAGISEQGELSNEVNTQFANELNTYADRILLHPSIYAPAIQKALTQPYVITPQALPVLENLSDHITGQTEILLHLPEHGDESY